MCFQNIPQKFLNQQLICGHEFWFQQFFRSKICCEIRFCFPFFHYSLKLYDLILPQQKLDWVGPVDSRPLKKKNCDTWLTTCDTWHVTHDMWHITCDTWHVTHDMWHVTCDMRHVTCDMWHVTYDTWHVTCCGGWTFSQNFSSLSLLVCA